MQLVNTDKVGTACKRAEAQSSKSCMQHAVFEWHCRAVLHTCWKLALPGWCVKPMLVKQPCRSFGNMMLCMQAHDYKDSDASIVNDQAHCTLVKKIQPLIHLQQLCTSKWSKLCAQPAEWTANYYWANEYNFVSCALSAYSQTWAEIWYSIALSALVVWCIKPIDPSVIPSSLSSTPFFNWIFSFCSSMGS